jgi:GDP-4-dehydro-6-deoxy-D-mannose reductase
MKKQNMTVLITGGTGFAGSHLVDALLADGFKNIHVTAYGNNTSYVHQILPSENIHQLDLTNKNKTFGLLEKLKPDHIYHLAATAAVGSSYDKAKKTVNNNFELQLNLLEGIKDCCPKARVLIIGSALEYQPQNRPLTETDPLGPVNPYGVSKVLQDTLAYSYARSFDLQIIRCRPFNHIGERQSLGFAIPDFAHQIAQIERRSKKPPAENQPGRMYVGNLEAIRDFTDVKDVVQAYILLMKQGQVNQVYNIGSGQGYQLKKLVNKLVEMSTAEVEVKVDQDKFRPLDVPQVVANNDRMKLLGWSPTIPINQTLKRVLNYYRKQVKEGTI